MNQYNEKALFDNADKFINLANEMSKIIGREQVGVAIRYAAARYSAFEASISTNNLVENKDKQLEFFVKAFTEMLGKNFKEYIEILSQRDNS